MIDLSRLNIETLMDVCAVANSPMYVYKHMRTDFSVQALAQHGAKALIETANEILDASEIHLEHVTKVYALLIALDSLDMLSINDAFEEFPLPALRWSADLVNIIKMNKVGFSKEMKTIMPKIILSTISTASNS